MLIKSGIIVGLFTFLSRISGFIREMFIAAIFGTSSIADSVNVALRFPNLFRRIFAEGAASLVFIPIFTRKYEESKDKAMLFSNKVFALLIIFLVIFTMILQILMPYLMYIIAPGFIINSDAWQYDLTILLCRISIIYLIFISASALFGSILNSIRKFAAFAFMPVILNLSILIFGFTLKLFIVNFMAIIYSVIIGGILQLIFMYICLRYANLHISFVKYSNNSNNSDNSDNQDIKLLLKNLIPASLTAGAGQLNLFMSQSLATFIIGGVSILSYADRLYQLPLSLIGITFGTILLPELSSIYKQKKFKQANILQNNAIKGASMLSIAAMIGMIALAKPLIYFIYYRGSFTIYDVENVTNALIAYSTGVPAFVLSKIITPIFYANLDSRTPLKITIFSFIFNLVISIILMQFFGYIGIALGSAFACWFNLYCLIKYASRYGEFAISKDTYIFILKIIFAGLIMGILVYLLRSYYLEEYYYHHKSLVKFAVIIFTIIIAKIIFFFICYLQKCHYFLITILDIATKSNHRMQTKNK